MIADAVPITVTNITAASAGAVITPINGSTYNWAVADLANGAGGIITITGRISSALTVGGRFTNTAVITSAAADSQANNNSSAAGLTVSEIDLALNATASFTTANSMTTITYTITISNPAATTATNVEVSNMLPVSVTLVTSSTSNYNPVTGVWAVDSVTGGGTAVLTMVVTGALSAGQTIINASTITSLDQIDPNIVNNTFSTTITIPADNSEQRLVYLPIIVREEN